MFSYLLWHYSDGFREVSRHAVVRALGFINFFSIPLLAGTLFAPWRRIVDPYARGFNPSDFFWTLGMNLVSRLVGAFARTVVILLGLITASGAAIAGVVFVGLWLAAPLLVFVVPLAGLLLLN